MATKPIKPFRIALTDSTDYDAQVFHINGAFIGNYRESNGSKVRLHLMGRDHWADSSDCETGEPQPAQPVSLANQLRSFLLGY